MKAYDGANHADYNVSVWNGEQSPHPNRDVAVEDGGPAPLAHLPDGVQAHPPIVPTARAGVK